jgi:hypothetical protein
MVLVAALYTTLVVTLNQIAQGGGSNLYDPASHPHFSPEQVAEQVWGSKIVVVSEQAMLNAVYAVKACMLTMYARLTLGLVATSRWRPSVRWLAVYTAAGYVASQVAFFTACRPFAAYWALPPPDEQCATLAHYSIVQAVFNISSDALMLGVPLPLVFRSTMPVRQKVVLSVIFSMGLFVITAAVLTKVYNLGDVFSPAYMLWYVREASVAVYVGNAPMVWPLLREWLPVLKGWTPGASSGRGKGTGDAGGGGTGLGKFGSRTGDGGCTTNSTGNKRGRANSLGSLDSAFDLSVLTGVGTGCKYKEGDSESTEQIVRGELDRSRDGSYDGIGIAVTKMGRIQVRRTVEVMEEVGGQNEMSGKRQYVVDVEAVNLGYGWERRKGMGCEDLEAGRF